MDCHEVLSSDLASEATAPFLFHFQDSYSSFRGIVVRGHPWVFQKVEHMVFEFSQAVADLSERLLELVEILIEKFVEALSTLMCRLRSRDLYFANARLFSTAPVAAKTSSDFCQGH